MKAYVVNHLPLQNIPPENSRLQDSAQQQPNQRSQINHFEQQELSQLELIIGVWCYSFNVEFQSLALCMYLNADLVVKKFRRSCLHPGGTGPEELAMNTRLESTSSPFS